MTESKTKGNIVVDGVMVFEDIYTMGGATGFTPRYSVTLQIAKGSSHEAALFEEMLQVAQDTWPTEWEAKLAAVHSDIMTGVSPGDSKVSCQDGDQYQPDYNAGFWVIKPSRREDQKQPKVFTKEGTLCPGGLEPGAPQEGWGVRVLMNVWAQKNRNRINFTVISVQGLMAGVKVGGPSPKVIEEEIQAALALPQPSAIPGVVTQQAQLPPQAAPAAPQAAPVPQVPTATTAVPGGPPAAQLGLDEPGGEIIDL